MRYEEAEAKAKEILYENLDPEAGDARAVRLEAAVSAFAEELIAAYQAGVHDGYSSSLTG